MVSGQWRAASGWWGKFYLLLCAGCLFLLASCTAGSPETIDGLDGAGISVAEAFAEFYAANGADRVFGAPVTTGFVAGDNGRFTQYFQNMRLEYDEVDGSVIVFPLGEWALTGVNDVQPVPTTENGRSRSFPETNLTVQDEFLSFYEAFNGEQLLGPPISPQMDEGDLRVQYFVNGRLEWHPELGVDQRIQVGPLGSGHFLAVGAAMYIPDRPARPDSFAGIEQVTVFTSVEKAVLYSGDEQTFYVTVFTPEMWPVDNIPVSVQVIYEETTAVLDLGRTDGNGRIVASLSQLDIPPGQTVELVASAYGSDSQVIGQSKLTFQTWW